MGLRDAVGNALARWPAWQDLTSQGHGQSFAELGMTDTAISSFTRTLRPCIREADTVVPSVCPYFARPKGSATYGLIINPARVTKVKYRAPYSDHWEERPLDWAMERIAQLVKSTRDRAYEAHDAGAKTLNRCTNIASVGGATLDNEENYLIKKLFGGGLGMVWIENQTRH
jgi:hypothetical protein